MSIAQKNLIVFNELKNALADALYSAQYGDAKQFSKERTHHKQSMPFVKYTSARNEYTVDEFALEFVIPDKTSKESILEDINSAFVKNNINDLTNCIITVYDMYHIAAIIEWIVQHAAYTYIDKNEVLATRYIKILKYEVVQQYVLSSYDMSDVNKALASIEQYISNTFSMNNVTYRNYSCVLTIPYNNY